MRVQALATPTVGPSIPIVGLKGATVLHVAIETGPSRLSIQFLHSTAHAQTYLSISVYIMVRKLAVSRLVRGKVAQAVPFRGGFAVVAGVAMFCVCVFSHFPAFF